MTSIITKGKHKEKKVCKHPELMGNTLSKSIICIVCREEIKYVKS